MLHVSPKPKSHPMPNPDKWVVFFKKMLAMANIFLKICHFSVIIQRVNLGKIAFKINV